MKRFFSLVIVGIISIFDGNILSTGYPAKLEYYGNSRGLGGGGVIISTAWNGNSSKGDVGGLKQKCPVWWEGYFLELQISCSRFLCPHFTLKFF